MRYEMKMPDLATTGSDLKIIRWHVKPGDKVRRGQPLMEIETDKATMDVECVVDGVLTEAVARENDAIGAGGVIAILEVADSPGSAQPVAAPEPAAPRKGMFARNRSAKAAPEAPIADATPAKTTRAMSIAHRTAMRRLVQSKQQVPHFYLQRSINAGAMIKRRKSAEPAKIAWDAFFAWGIHRALSKFDQLKYRVEGETLVLQESDTIGIAVDHEGDLYVVPVTPAGKTPEQISEELMGTVGRLRTGDRDAKRMHPCLLTITNLGAQGIEAFIPIINPPESAILGIGRVMPTPVARQDGRIGVEQRAMLTLSVDHRVVSGRYAAEFLSAVIAELEGISPVEQQ